MFFSETSNNLAAANEALEMILSEPDPNFVPNPDSFTPGTLTTTTVIPNSYALPAAQPSIRAVNSKIIVGTKDHTLRHASDIFQAAAERTANVVEKGERYWETAVRLRRNNWPLLAAPLRSQTDFPVQRQLQSTDTYARDFRISYGLEHGECQVGWDWYST